MKQPLDKKAYRRNPEVIENQTDEILLSLI